MSKVFAYAVVCERILNEVDGFASIIRVADMFNIKLIDGVDVNAMAVAVSLLVSIRVAEDEGQEHRSEVILVRPDGEEQPIGEPIVGKIVQKSPLAPGGLNLVFQIAVVPRIWGLHMIKVLFDGQVVAETIFTLAKLEETTTANSQSPAPEHSSA